MKIKKGQTELSFNMIFSIIMIIGILSFGGYVIYKFAVVSDCTENANFAQMLQEDIDKIYYKDESSATMEYSLSKSKEKVCIIDTENSQGGEDAELYDEIQSQVRSRFNLLIYPSKGSSCDKYKIEHMDFQKMNSNPLCFDNKNGRVKIAMSKAYGDRLVALE